MRVRRTPQFDEERERFSLRYCCEDCAHFEQADERCRHEWPNQQHRAGVVAEMIGERSEALRGGSAAEDARWIDFCKEFELC